ncbi:hypothetical protein Tsubulata_030436 [Turnera subulata]|uniref:NTF2 domain-containing protein n=1 Tax=Turnera subulata TaxID=218843 RepID=A0A9Q0FFN0_9ROSI|nr:hypothetical protein Tsubulata_030436 [Turnera subulata]
MLSPEMAAPVVQSPVTADIVGHAFVHQYYLILHQSPELVHRFYQDGSKLGRHGEDGIMSTTTTMQAINEKILSLGYAGYVAEISSVDSQESFNGGVLVLVTGFLKGNDNLRLKFTQTFFLAPQDKGYYVLNDVFRYVDGPKHQDGNEDHDSNVECHPTPVQESASVQENHISVLTAQSEEVNGGEVYNPPENGDDVVEEQEEEEEPVPEVVDEVPDVVEVVADSQTVSESDTKVEDLPKKSYASIVRVLKVNAAPSASPTSTPLRSAPKSQDPMTTVVSPLSPPLMPLKMGILKRLKLRDLPSMLKVCLQMPHLHYLRMSSRNLGQLDPVVSKLDVKRDLVLALWNLKWQVLCKVHWRELLLMLQASPIMINGCRVIVEEKRSTYRGKLGTIGDGFHLEQGLGTEMREQEDVATLGAEVMAGVILLEEQIMETGEEIEVDFQIVEVMGIGGLTRWEAMVDVQTVLVG